jgi:predicted lipid-binding transport protein (Tim44 family)
VTIDRATQVHDVTTLHVTAQRVPTRRAATTVTIPRSTPTPRRKAVASVRRPHPAAVLAIGLGIVGGLAVILGLGMATAYTHSGGKVLAAVLLVALLLTTATKLTTGRRSRRHCPGCDS